MLEVVTLCHNLFFCYIRIIEFQNKRAAWKGASLRIDAGAIRSFFCLHHARFERFVIPSHFILRQL